MQHNDAHCKQVVQDILSSELMTLFELQKFCNKLHTAMAGHIASHGGVFESVVRSWEDELETLKPLVTRVDTGKSYISRKNTTNLFLIHYRLLTLLHPGRPTRSAILLPRQPANLTPSLPN